MDIHRLIRPGMRHFRTKRIRQMYALLNLSPETRVLDVGGSWRNFWRYAPWLPQVTIMNVTEDAMNLAAEAPPPPQTLLTWSETVVT